MVALVNRVAAPYETDIECATHREAGRLNFEISTPVNVCIFSPHSPRQRHRANHVVTFKGASEWNDSVDRYIFTHQIQQVRLRPSQVNCLRALRYMKIANEPAHLDKVPSPLLVIDNNSLARQVL